MASRVLRSRVLLSAPWSPMRPVRAAGLSDMSRWRFGMNPSCTPTESRMGCDSAGASSRVGTAIRGMLRFSSRWGMALIASDGNGEASHRQSMTSSAPSPRSNASRARASGKTASSTGRPRASIGACRSRTNADDRLPRASLSRVEGGDSVIEGRDVADVRPQSSVPHSLDDLTQLGTIGLDNEVDREAVDGPRLGRPDDGHQCSSGSNQACGPLLDVAADDIEHQIDAADVFQRVVVEVDELLRAEVERLLTVGSASSSDDVAAGLTCELRHHRADCAGCAVREDALPRLKAAVLEQSLPCGKARDWQARAHREVDVTRQRRNVACLDGYILREGAVAMPVGETEPPLPYRQSRRAVAESGDDSGQLVAGDRRCSVTVAAIGPGRGPRQLSRDESRRMNLNDDVVYRCLRLGPLHQLHPGRSRSLVRHDDRLHMNRLLGYLSGRDCNVAHAFFGSPENPRMRPTGRLLAHLEP